MHELNTNRAQVVSVYDGDSFHAIIDMGMGLTWSGGLRPDYNDPPMVRVAGIDAWEIRGEERPAGLKAKRRVEELIGGDIVMLKTYEWREGKYDRIVADVYFPEEGKELHEYDRMENMRNLADILVAEGHADRVD